ncbi:MAG: redoxin domain-containing protein [Anaerolineae bacterium]|nr:redoxin domain-containing protein [Anaerolineae bacterium]
MDAEKIAVGMRAPDFRLPALSGGEVSLGEMVGAPLVIYFMRAFQ